MRPDRRVDHFGQPDNVSESTGGTISRLNKQFTATLEKSRGEVAPGVRCRRVTHSHDVAPLDIR
jgi:hypothetical protein